ncbi:MAG: AarF/ABC1/UbiB kinase family protein, partial [Synechococcaceae cyanobacterium SM2_3_1]|nr:AarF/ABC1/UbiB kinase family protein [Synechococcaceae cyanobacterium SM2_3_1]
MCLPLCSLRIPDPFAGSGLVALSGLAVWIFFRLQPGCSSTLPGTIFLIGKSELYRSGRWLTQQLLDLGPTFIKIGQALSTRVDLLPLPVVTALSQLQDKVPGFPTLEAIAIVETELSSSILSLYREFDSIPIAAASLGQVHKAVLHSGEEVVIKVQRSGLQELFALDLKVCRELISVAEGLFSDLRQYKLGEIYNEFFD